MPMKLPDVKQRVKITDGYKKPLAEIRRDVDKTKSNFQRLRKTIQRASSGANLKKLKSSIMQVRTAAAGLGAGFKQSATRAAYFTGIATAAIGGLVGKTAQYGDNIAKTARKLNLSVEALQELRHAANLSGIEQSKFDNGMLKFQKRLGETVAGIGYAKDIYKDLGIEIQDSNGKIKPTEKLFAQVSDKLIGMDDATKRTRYAMELFGRSGADMVLMMKDGSAGIQKMRTEARKLGGVMSADAAAQSENFIDTMARTKQVVGGVVRELAVALMPAIMDLAKRLQSFIKENRPAIQAFFKQFAEYLPNAINRLIKFFENMAQRLAPIFNWIGKAINSIGWENSAMMAMGLFIGGPMIRSLTNIIPLVQGLINGVRAAIPLIKSMWVALASNPVMLAVTAIAALVAVVFLFRKQLKPIIDAFKQGLEPMFAEWRILVSEIKTAWEELTRSINVSFGEWSGLSTLLINVVGALARLAASIVSVPFRLAIAMVRVMVLDFRIFLATLKSIWGWLNKNFGPQIDWLGKKMGWLGGKIGWVIDKLRAAYDWARKAFVEVTKALGVAPEAKTATYNDKDLGTGTTNRRLGLSGRQLTDAISQIGNPTYNEPTLAQKVEKSGGVSGVSVAELMRLTGDNGGGGKRSENQITIDFKNMPKGVNVAGTGDAPIKMNTGHAFGGAF